MAFCLYKAIDVYLVKSVLQWFLCLSRRMRAVYILLIFASSHGEYYSFSNRYRVVVFVIFVQFSAAYTATADVAGPLGIGQLAISATNKVLNLYKKNLDTAIPWDNLQQIRKTLTTYQRQYSRESGEIVGKITTLMMNAIDDYYAATESIYEWCDLMSRVLPAYMKLFDDFNASKARTQNNLMITLLDVGLGKMEAGQSRLNHSSFSFNEVSGQAVALSGRMNDELKINQQQAEEKTRRLHQEAKDSEFHFLFIHIVGKKSDDINKVIIPEIKRKFAEVQKFHDDIAALVKKAKADIEDVKQKLRDEYHTIGTLKTDAQALKSFIDTDQLDILEILKTETQNAAVTLLKDAEDYKQRHNSSLQDS